MLGADPIPAPRARRNYVPRKALSLGRWVLRCRGAPSLGVLFFAGGVESPGCGMRLSLRRCLSALQLLGVEMEG